MNRKPSLLATAIILAAPGTSWGQPVITNQPAPQAAAPGTSATFQVGANGIEPITYQWQKDLGKGFADLADRTNAVLTLANLQPWDACPYCVVVANGTGASTSAVARLYLVRAPQGTTNVVVDSFNDNRATGWTPEGHQGQVKLTSSWVIERALEPDGPWTTLTALLIAPHGAAECQDPLSPSAARFYRARQQE